MATKLDFDIRVGQQLNGVPVLVTGATGFTGSHLVRKLLSYGAKVRAIARASSDLSQFKGLDIEWFRGDVYDAKVIEAAAANVHYIFHVAAAFRQAKIEDKEYSLVHVESTKLLAQAALTNRDFKRFVHVSTMGVHGHIKTPPGNEESPYSPGDVYQVTKLEAEVWLREFANREALPYCVIRPTAIFGPGDRRLFKIFKMSTWRIFPILGFGKCLYHLIHVDDLCKAIILAALEPAALAQVFLIGNTDAIRLEDIAKIISREYGRKIQILRIPVTPFFWLAAICELVCRPFGIEPPLYRRRVAFYTKDRSFNTSKMQKVLAFTPEFTNEAGLVETAHWYLMNRWITLPGKASGGSFSNNKFVNEGDIKRQANS